MGSCRARPDVNGRVLEPIRTEAQVPFAATILPGEFADVPKYIQLAPEVTRMRAKEFSRCGLKRSFWTVRLTSAMHTVASEVVSDRSIVRRIDETHVRPAGRRPRISCICAGTVFPFCAGLVGMMLRSPMTRGERQRLLAAVGVGALPTLARCLSGTVLRQFSVTGRCTYLAGALAETGFASQVGDSTTLCDALRIIFDLIRTAYRSDYVYRTAIANKLFLGRHSPATTTLLSEVRVWRSKADMAMFNGTSIAYEIKTELDNLDRLGSQVRDYSAMFDLIYVVTHEARVSALRDLLPLHVGILVLSRSFSFHTEREAVSNADNVHPPTIVDALRRHEVIELTEHVTGSIPSATSVALIGECQKVLASQPPRSVHDAMVPLFKRRIALTREKLGGVPAELLTAYLESGLHVRHWRSTADRLTCTTIGDVVSRPRGHLFSLPSSETG
jgi:hypothetical protein